MRHGETVEDADCHGWNSSLAAGNRAELDSEAGGGGVRDQLPSFRNEGSDALENGVLHKISSFENPTGIQSRNDCVRQDPGSRRLPRGVRCPWRERILEDVLSTAPGVRLCQLVVQ